MSNLNVTPSSSSTAGNQPENSNSNSNILLGKYEVGRILGRGICGKVYYARNITTGQKVAIKAISREKVIQSGQVENIKREISIMRRLRHPHIIKVIEILATRTKIYFVLEFAKGGEIFAKLLKGRFSEDLSRRYFQQLISAVRYCHSNGIFHRDLKPENLLLDENWNLKVSDFGLSAVRDQIKSDGLLHTQCGTPTYVAPEVLAKKGYDGAKADLWSCGIVLFVFNASYLPFYDTNLMAMYGRISRGRFRCPSWFSPELRHLLSRLLDTNPDTRITIDEVIEHPWFKKGGNYYACEVRLLEEQKEEVEREFRSLKLEQNKKDSNGERAMNAFDLISFSSGTNLSGLFKDPTEALGCYDEFFFSAVPPDRLMDEIEAALQREKEDEELVVERRDRRLRVEGQNGNIGIFLGVHRFTGRLVIVEVRKRGKNMGPSHEYWKYKMRPRIRGLVYDEGHSVSLPTAEI